jgi:hypothetical protein
MKRRSKNQTIFTTPRVLAIVSCALALLAAAPPAAGPAKDTTRQSGAITYSEAPATPQLAVEAKPVSSPSVSVRRFERSPSLLSSARRLHILATMEILQRLIAAELQPLTTHHLVLPTLFLEPVPVASLAPPLQLPHPPSSANQLIPPAEQLFVLEHSLSAPPRA